jgi:hypothetical protein
VVSATAATAAEVRQHVATAVVAGLGSSWRQSVFTPTSLLADGAGAQPLRVSVEVPSSEYTRQPGRQRTSTQAAPPQARTLVRVRLARRLVLDGQVATYDALLGDERTVYAALDSVDWRGAAGPQLVGWQRETTADAGWLVSTLSMYVDHPMGA